MTRATIQEGLLYERPRGYYSLLCASGKSLPLETLVLQYLGVEVRVCLEMIISKTPNASRWASGSCYWEGAGTCPAGHHKEKDKSLRFSAVGQLTRGWEVGGEKVSLEKFNGHYVLLVVTPVRKDLEGDLRKLQQMLKTLRNELF